jgi:glutaconate CoA-transferase subunit B
MVCEMARAIRDGETVFHGIASPMPMAAILLARATHAKTLTYLNLPGGVNPAGLKPERYSSITGNLAEQGNCYFPLADIFDLAMRGGLDTAFFSGVQFDAAGNVNASVIGTYNRPRVRLPGGAGSAVLLPVVKRAILWRTKHDRRTFVQHVDFITARGNIDKIITPLAVFVYREGRLLLERLHPHTSPEEVADNTGFALEPLSAEGPGQTVPPTQAELFMLNRIDPNDSRNTEFLET